MSKLTELLKAFTNGTLGGSADLSEIDENITVVNEHVIDFQGDIGSNSELRASVGWDDDTYGVTVRGTEPSYDYTDLYVIRPSDHQHRVDVSTAVQGNNPGVSFRIPQPDPVFSWNARIFQSPDANERLVTDDLLHRASHGPILVSPDESLHRLVVADDGTLSTEPVI